MAAVIGALRAELSATIAKFQEDMKNAGAAVRDFATKAEKQGKRIQAVGRNLSLALTAPLVAFGIKSVQAAKESAEALGQIEAALRSTGNRAGKTTQQLQASAKALESISVFDDDDILLQTTANLLKFGNVVGETFDKAQLAIVNMAARTGDLGSATQMIGRALNDPIQGLTALSRAGVQFTTQQKEQIKALVVSGRGIEAQAMILKALEAAYGGAAKAQRDASPTAALNQQWRELTEIIGGILIDVLPPVINFLRGIAEAFNALSPGMQAAVVYGGLLAAALGPLLVVVGSLTRAVAFLTPVMAALAAVVGTITVATWAWVAAIAAAVAALVIFWKSVKDLLHGDFEKAWEDAKSTARDMWNDLTSMFAKKPIQAPIELQAVGKGPTPAVPSFSLPPETLAARKTLDADLRKMGEKISSAFRKVEMPKAVSAAADLNAEIDETIRKAEAAGIKTAGWSNEVAGLRDRIESLKQAGLAKEAQEFARAVDEDAIAVRRFAAGSLDPLNEKLTTIDQAYQALRLKIEAAIEENRELALVNDAAAQAMSRLEQQLADLENAHSKATEAATAQWQAEQKLADISARRENVQTQEQLADLHRARGDSGVMTPDERRREQIARDLEFTQIDAEEKLAQLQGDRIQAELVGDTAAIERLDTQIILQEQLHALIAQTTVDQIRDAERLQDAFDGFFSDVQNEFMRMAKEGKFTFDGLRTAIRDMLFDAFVKPHIEQAGGILKTIVGAGLNAIGGQIGGWVGDILAPPATQAPNGDWIPGPGGFPEPKKNATGGFIPPGQWEIAGDAGPELLFGGKKGVSVFSNQDSRDMLRGGGDTYVTNNIRTQDSYSFMRTSRQVARQTKRALQEG